MIPKKFGDKLRKVREAKKISRANIAEEIGVHLNTYSSYERGDRFPDADFVYKFCEKLNVNHIWLFTGRGSMIMPSNPTGLEPKLLEKIIAKVEEHLDQSAMLLSSSKKAEIISILYEEALDNQDWQEQLGIDKKTLRFIDLLASKEGSITVANQSFDKRLNDVIEDIGLTDIDISITRHLKGLRNSGKSLTRPELIDSVLKLLHERIMVLRKEKAEKELNRILLILCSTFSMVVGVLSGNTLTITGLIIGGILLGLGFFLVAWRGPKVFKKIILLDREIKSAEKAFDNLNINKINREIEEAVTDNWKNSLNK